MSAETYSLPIYHSAVDGLIVSKDNFSSKRSLPLFSRPKMFSPSYLPSYPKYPNILRSSTGPVVYRRPPITTTTILRPTNLRWESGINLVDIQTRPLNNHHRYSLHNPVMIVPMPKLIRSESLQIMNQNSQQRINEIAKFDAKHFCGLPPIHENKLAIREIPSFRVTGVMRR